MTTPTHDTDPDHGAPIGYLPRWSYHPTDHVDVHVWCTQRWSADLVQLHYGDPRPDGPGLQETPLGVASGTCDPVTMPTQAGSMAWAPVSGLPPQLVVVSWIRPTRPSAPQTRIALAGLRHDGSVAWSVGVGPDGRWNTTGATDPVAGTEAGPEWRLVQHVIDDDVAIARPAGDVTYIGIGGGLPLDPEHELRGNNVTFDGVIAEPCLLSRALNSDDLQRVRAGARITDVAGDALLAGWAFPAAHPPVTYGPAADGPVILRNTPAAAMPGPHGVRDALHCHADDLTDAGWPIGTQLALPADLRSGVYAVRLQSVAGVDRIPFVVAPPNNPRAGDAAPALLVLPTMTYLAYANERLASEDSYLADHFGNLAEQMRPAPIDRWLDRHPEFGFSCYDRHVDSSGVVYSSLRRPIPSIRPDYLHWVDGEPRHLGLDLFIVDWLNRVGIPYDVACDHDLDEQGFKLLEPYRVIITGSHPEYVSPTMFDALEDHLNRDGRLMYLGGNGFYWVTSTSAHDPTTIEVRRGRNGQFPWQSGHGEDTHAYDGHTGGLWSDHDRPPQALVGLTFAAMGTTDPPPGYVLNDHVPTTDRWILDGVNGPTIGTRGRLAGGAAGHEIDCVDHRNGHPDGVAVLASSTGHSDTFVTSADVHDTGGLDTARGDLVLYHRPHGGTVLATGSINWTGSLAQPGGDPDIQRLTENALRRFIQPHGSE